MGHIFECQCKLIFFIMIRHILPIWSVVMSSGIESRSQDSRGDVVVNRDLWDKYSNAVVAEIKKGRDEGSIVRVLVEKKGIGQGEASWLVGCVSEKMIEKGLLSKEESEIELVVEEVVIKDADCSGRFGGMVDFSDLADCEDDGG